MWGANSVFETPAQLSLPTALGRLGQHSTNTKENSVTSSTGLVTVSDFFCSGYTSHAVWLHSLGAGETQEIYSYSVEEMMRYLFRLHRRTLESEREEWVA